MPTACKAEYEEAADIFARSPRGAAALLRLCVQKLVGELGEDTENLNAAIGKLVEKGLPVEVQMALDSVRVIGNNAVHPGEIRIEDEPETAAALFELINLIVEDRISRPARVAGVYAKLPPTVRDAIAVRDTKASH
jgi:hypothetical protein